MISITPGRTLQVIHIDNMRKYYLIAGIALIAIVVYFLGEQKGVEQGNVKYIEYSNRSVKGAVKLNFDSLGYKVDVDGWEVVVHSESDVDLYFALRKEDNDTSKFLNLFAEKNQTVKKIDSYRKEFSSEGLKHVVSMHEDTFFYYVENKFHEKTFLRGEYNFKFANALLEPVELGYYILYKDSLGEVRGSDLPKLPAISADEKRKIDELDSLNQAINK